MKVEGEIPMSNPNIVFYFSDQQRADTCGCYGQELDITPYLDTLAQEGTCFEQAFSPQPVCGPCRALFQTGLYPTETGCFRNNVMLPKNVKTVAQYLEEAGYETAYIGKWHLASDGELEKAPTVDYQTKAVPPELRGGYTGFWRAADVLEFTSDGYGGYVFDENMNKIEFSGYRADCITDLALDFFNQRDTSKPFFMTISHIEPHHQNNARHYQGPEGSKEKYKHFTIPGDLKAFSQGDYLEEYPDYLGACASLDENLGKLINKLKEENLYDNTVIIYASDHGSHFKTRNQDSHLCGYDDYKRSCHDGALKVPFVIAGGPFKNKGHFKDIVSTASLPKTILALAGIDVGDNMIGENLIDVVNGELPNRLNEAFAQISESRVGRCLRTPDYLYSVYAPGKNGGEYKDSDEYADDFLYDLRTDPYQLHNLVRDKNYEEVKLHLRKRLLDWIHKYEHTTPVIHD